MGRKFDKNPLAVKQNNYTTTKNLNAYILYDLDAWKISNKKKCLFGAYGGYVITFDGES